VSVEPFHLFRYLDEQVFRYNNRKGLNDGERFDIAVRRIFGKRLTWDQLTGVSCAMKEAVSLWRRISFRRCLSAHLWSMRVALLQTILASRPTLEP
jgi:hypothetical protein